MLEVYSKSWIHLNKLLRYFFLVIYTYHKRVLFEGTPCKLFCMFYFNVIWSRTVTRGWIGVHVKFVNDPLHNVMARYLDHAFVIICLSLVSYVVYCSVQYVCCCHTFMHYKRFHENGFNYCIHVLSLLDAALIDYLEISVKQASN